MLASLLDILAIFMLALAAYGLGRPLLRRIRLGSSDPLTIGVYSVGLGLLAADVVLLALGLVGWLVGWAIMVLTTIGCCWSIFEIGRAWMQASLLGPSQAVEEVPFEEFTAAMIHQFLPSRWLASGMILAAAILLSCALAQSLTPPISGESLGSQLYNSKAALLQHRVLNSVQGGRNAPGVQNIPRQAAVSLSPMDLWCLWAMALRGETCAQVLHWGLCVLLVLSVVLLASPVLGRPWAWAAGVVSLTSPYMSQKMIALPDAVAITICCTLAAAAWWQATIHGENERWVWVAGIFTGGAIAVHWASALIFLTIMAISLAWSFWRHRDQRPMLLHAAAITALIAIGVGCVLSPPLSMASHRGMASVIPSHNNASLLMHGELHDFLGFVALAAVPGLFFARKLRGFGPLAWLAGGCILFGSLLCDGRLLFVAIPPICIAVVWAWMEMRRLPRRVLRVVMIAFAVILASTILTPLFRSGDAVRLAVGMDDREHYLQEHEPTYRAAVVANEMLGPDAHILSQDENVLYFNCPVTSEAAFRQTSRDIRQDSEPNELTQQIRAAGFTHLLLANTAGAVAGEGLESHEVPQLCDHQQLLDDYLFHTTDGTVRHYRLISLK